MRTTMSDDPSKTRPSISRLVAILNDHGFDTGEMDEESDTDIISMMVKAHHMISSSHALVELMASLGVEVGNICDECDSPGVRAVFYPVEGFAILDLVNVDDSMLCEDSLEHVEPKLNSEAN